MSNDRHIDREFRKFQDKIWISGAEFQPVSDEKLADRIIAAYERVDLPSPSVVFTTGIDDFTDQLRRPGNEEVKLYTFHDWEGHLHGKLFHRIVTGHGGHPSTVGCVPLKCYLSSRDLKVDLVGYYDHHRYSGLVRVGAPLYACAADQIRGLAEIELNAFAVYFGWQSAIVLPTPVSEFPVDEADRDEDVLPRYQWADGSSLWQAPCSSRNIGEFNETLARKNFSLDDLEGLEDEDKESLCRRIGWAKVIKHFGCTDLGTDDDGSRKLSINVFGTELEIFEYTTMGEQIFFEHFERKLDMFGPKWRADVLRNRVARKQRQKIVASGRGKLLPSPPLQIDYVTREDHEMAQALGRFAD